MILLCNDGELNIIGEISKVNMVSETGRSYINVVTNCEKNENSLFVWAPPTYRYNLNS